MAEVNDIALRFAAGLNGRREASAAQLADRAAIAERAFAPALARVQGIELGLVSLGREAERITPTMNGPSAEGDYTLTITFAGVGSPGKLDLRLENDAAGANLVSITGLDSEVAAELVRAGGAYSGLKIVVGPDRLDALCDAIEAAALNYFSKG